MRKLKRGMFLVTVALTALAVLAPSAVASEFTKNGSPLEAPENEVIQLEGTITRHLEGYWKWPYPTGRTTCEFDAELELRGGGNGSVISFATDVETCESETSHWNYACQVLDEEVSMPWGLHVSEQKIVANYTSIFWETAGECGSYFDDYYYAGDMEMVPDNAEEISSLSFAAPVSIPGSMDKELTFSASVSPAGVYGIK